MSKNSKWVVNCPDTAMKVKPEFSDEVIERLRNAIDVVFRTGVNGIIEKPNIYFHTSVAEIRKAEN